MFFLSKKKTEKVVAGKCEWCDADITEEREVDSKRIVTKAIYKTEDGKYVCMDCLNRYNVSSVTSKKITYAELYEMIKKKNKNRLLPNEFHPTKIIYAINAIGNLHHTTPAIALAIDEKNRKLVFTRDITKHFFSMPKKVEIARDMSKLVDFELLDNGKKQIIGDNKEDKKIKEKCTSLILKVVFDDVNEPEECIYFISNKMNIVGMGARDIDRESMGYKALLEVARQCVSLLTLVKKSNEDSAVSSVRIVGDSVKSEGTDNLEILKKLASLHDAGILTDEEFAAKKAELLSRI